MPTSRHRRNGRTRPRIRHAVRPDPRCAACNDPSFDPAADWQRQVDRIAQHGWTAQVVLGSPDQQEYVYTMGLSDQGHPELVIMGPRADWACDEIKVYADAVCAGARVDSGEVPQSCGCPMRLVPVMRGVIDLNRADRAHGSPVDAVQIVLADDGGCYPGEPGYDHERCPQPLLGVPWW